jgi:zinc/manganese transport system substrate-binding protein
VLSRKPSVINGGDVVGLRSGDNPHIWYGPDYVYKIAASVTEALKQLAPDIGAYFDQQYATWREMMRPTTLRSRS